MARIPDAAAGGESESDGEGKAAQVGRQMWRQDLRLMIAVMFEGVTAYCAASWAGGKSDARMTNTCAAVSFEAEQLSPILKVP